MASIVPFSCYSDIPWYFQSPHRTPPPPTTPHPLDPTKLYLLLRKRPLDERTTCNSILLFLVSNSSNEFFTWARRPFHSRLITPPDETPPSHHQTRKNFDSFEKHFKMRSDLVGSVGSWMKHSHHVSFTVFTGRGFIRNKNWQHLLLSSKGGQKEGGPPSISNFPVFIFSKIFKKKKQIPVSLDRMAPIIQITFHTFRNSAHCATFRRGLLKFDRLSPSGCWHVMTRV